MSIKSKVIQELSRRPRRMGELKKKLGNDRKVLAAVNELEKQGKLSRRDGMLVLTGKKELMAELEDAIPCTLVKLGATFGFATRDDGEGDIFIPGRSLMGAMPQDQVLVRLFPNPRVPGSVEGEVVAITKEQNRFVGVIAENEKGRLVLIPDRCPDTPLLIRKNADGGATPGEKAAVEILERGTSHSDHRAGVAVRFGNSQSAAICIKGLLYDRGIQRQFPDLVKKEAKKLENVQINSRDWEGRTDLRDMPIFTIDSESTRDIDDAVSCREISGGYELGVHIADVSHYVTLGSQLDQEAFHRGTSIYFGNKVIPMLPKQLSNGICSLNPGEDRLALSCLIRLDLKGNIKEYRFAKSVIHSRVKGVYEEINAILAGQASPELYAKYGEVSGQFDPMLHLYHLREKLRDERGGMRIESNECKFLFDEDGRCVDILKRERGLSEQMIEEFMLLANECAANLARTEEFPLVYRVHEEPDAQRMEKLQTVLEACGLHPVFKKAVPTQKELGVLLDETRGTTLERAVHTGVLRSMAKARYEDKPLGHFGLALEDYAHFTSPIRRYPDLAVHRILTDYLDGMPISQLKQEYGEFVREAGLQSSQKEGEAMQMERDADDLYMAEYMQSHLGESYEGIVSGVTRRRIFVELSNGVEGSLAVEELCKGEPVVHEGVRVSDPISGKSWMLGDPIMVTVASVQVPMARIDLVPAKPQKEE